MEKLDLTKLPIGTKVWSPLFGDGEINGTNLAMEYPINVKGNNDLGYHRFMRDGKYLDYEEGECLLFPSKENQSWADYFKTFIPDKALVWCWDRDYKFERILRFYDEENGATFRFNNGRRNGTKFDKYELYEGEYPEWAKEAQKLLED